MKSLLSLIFLLLIGCQPQHDLGNVKNKNFNIKWALQNPGGVDFEFIKNNILDQHCLRCHNSEVQDGGVRLDHYKFLLDHKNKSVIQEFLPLESSLYLSLVTRSQLEMPPQGTTTLSSKEVQIIKNWIELGAIEKSSHGDQALEKFSLEQILQPYFDSPETIDYQVVKKYIFSQNCYDCHSQQGAKRDKSAMDFGVDLTTYKSLINGFTKTVVKGKPVESLLYTSLVVDQSMPPEVMGYKLLSPYKAKLLRLWILNCAIEDYSKEITLSSAKNKKRVCNGEF